MAWKREKKRPRRLALAIFITALSLITLAALLPVLLLYPPRSAEEIAAFRRHLEESTAGRARPSELAERVFALLRTVRGLHDTFETSTPEEVDTLLTSIRAGEPVDEGMRDHFRSSTARIFEELRALPRGARALPEPVAAEDWSSSVSWVSELRALAQWTELECALLGGAGEKAAAFDLLLRQLTLDPFSDPPLLIELLVRTGVLLDGLPRLAALARAADDAALQEAVRLLTAADLSIVEYDAAMMKEALFTLVVLQEAAEGSGIESAFGLPAVAQVPIYGRIYLHHEVGQAVKRWQEFFALDRSTWPRLREGARKWSGEIRSPGSVDPRGVLSQALFLASAKLLERMERRSFRVRATRLSLTLELHRRRSGSYPERLAELEPILGGPPPADATSGEPFGYRRTSDGYLLYGLGEDGEDQGGEATGDDVVVEVPGTP